MSTFSKKCQLSWHQANDKPKSFNDIIQRRYVPTDVRDYIIKNKLLLQNKTKRATFVCDICIARVTEHIQGPGKRGRTEPDPNLEIKKISLEERPSSPTASTSGCTTTSENIDSEDAVKLVCESLQKGTLSKTQKDALVDSICTSMINEMREESDSGLATREEDIYADSYVDVWKSIPDSLMKKFLEGLANDQTMDNTLARKQVKAREIMQWIVDKQMVSNFSLGEAMLLMNFSHSKYAVELFGKILPAGSFRTVRRTVTSLDSGEEPLPANDIIFAFDNNQKVGRNWKLTYQGRQPISTVTVLLFFDMGSASQHQFRPKIQTALFPTPENKDILMNRYKEFVHDSHLLHRNYRDKMIKQLIDKISSECTMDSGIVKDSVTTSTCSKIGEIFFDNSRVPNFDRRLPVHDLDAIDVNPNSYDSLAKVLDKLVDYADNSNRSYVTCVMDGQPFLLAANLIKETVVCSMCKASMPENVSLEHSETSHQTESVTFSRKYRKIAIRPGAGHIDLNTCRLILDKFFDIFIKPIASLMEYRGENSLQFCRRGLDHHRAYHLLTVVFASIASEIVFEFVSYAMKESQPLTVEEFWKFHDKRAEKNLTFRMCMQFCFNTLHSLNLYRHAIRMANDEVALAARERMAALFYVSGSTKYQELLAYDTLYLLSLPKEARKVVQIDSSKGPTGEVAEGIDYLVEGRNRLYKSFLPTDSTPTPSHWLHVSRVAGKLEKLRHHACNRTDLRLEPNVPQCKKLDTEIFQARKYIRALQLLNQTSLDLYNFADPPVKMEMEGCMYDIYAKENQLKYYESFLSNKRIHLPLVHFLTEEPKGTNQKDLVNLLNQKISELQDPFQSVYKKAVKNAKSADELYELHSAIKAQLRNQVERQRDDCLYDQFDNGFDEDGIDVADED